MIDGFIAFLLLVKSSTHSPEEVFETRQYGPITQGYVEAFRLYEEHRAQLKVRFLKISCTTVKLMLRQPATQRYVQNRVDHLIVDEAQDMNGIQIALLKILAGDRAKVMLVGDETRPSMIGVVPNPTTSSGALNKTFQKPPDTPCRTRSALATCFRSRPAR